MQSGLEPRCSVDGPAGPEVVPHSVFQGDTFIEVLDRQAGIRLRRRNWAKPGNLNMEIYTNNATRKSYVHTSMYIMMHVNV